MGKNLWNLNAEDFRNNKGPLDIINEQCDFLSSFTDNKVIARFEIDNKKNNANNLMGFFILRAPAIPNYEFFIFKYELPILGYPMRIVLNPELRAVLENDLSKALGFQYGLDENGSSIEWIIKTNEDLEFFLTEVLGSSYVASIIKNMLSMVAQVSSYYSEIPF